MSFRTDIRDAWNTNWSKHNKNINNLKKSIAEKRKELSERDLKLEARYAFGYMKFLDILDKLLISSLEEVDLFIKYLDTTNFLKNQATPKGLEAFKEILKDIRDVVLDRDSLTAEQIENNVTFSKSKNNKWSRSKRVKTTPEYTIDYIRQSIALPKDKIKLKASYDYIPKNAVGVVIDAHAATRCKPIEYLVEFEMREKSGNPPLVFTAEVWLPMSNVKLVARWTDKGYDRDKNNLKRVPKERSTFVSEIDNNPYEEYRITRLNKMKKRGQNT